ncbi:MAG: hypothetical protein VB055_01775 [Oscillospiraceae bacterium]|nr:hypothetical protein [Oscillospiraceae bacterium]
MRSVKAARLISVICAGLMGITGIAVMLFLRTHWEICWTIVGYVLILVGISKSISYFARDLYELAFQFDMSLGILVAMAGLAMILHPSYLKNFFPFIAGALVVTDCGFKLQSAMDAKAFGIRQWPLLAAASGGCTAGGILLMLLCEGLGNQSTLFSGLILLADGLLNLLTVLITVRIPSERSQTSCTNLEKES